MLLPTQAMRREAVGEPNEAIVHTALVELHAVQLLCFEFFFRMSEELLRRRAAEEGWWDALLFDVGLAVVLFVVVAGLISLPIYVSKRMRGDIRWLRRSSRRGRLVQEHLGAAS